MERHLPHRPVHWCPVHWCPGNWCPGNSAGWIVGVGSAGKHSWLLVFVDLIGGRLIATRLQDGVAGHFTARL